MKKNFVAFLFGVFLITSPVSARAAENILIVFDASGSMLEQFGAGNRMTAAKAAVSDLLASIDPSVKVGLRPYAEVKKSTQAEACKQTTLAVPFTTERAVVRSKVNSLQAVGSYTPTAYALLQAKNDFVPGEDNALILLTDGKETCGGDPAAAAKALLDAGINVKTYVIGIDLDATAKAELSAVAESGGGTYFDAKDSASLASSLESIQEAEKPIDKTNTDAQLGTAIRGGNGYETAVDIVPGTYHLDHHQKGDEYDYFKLEVEKGVSVTIRIVTPETGVTYDAKTDTFTESKGARVFASARLMDGYRTRIDDAYVDGRSQRDEFTHTPKESGTLYVLFGSAGPMTTAATSMNTLFIIEKEKPEDIGAVSAQSQGGTGQTGQTTGNDTSGSSNESTATIEGEKDPSNTLLYVAIGIGILVALLLLVLIVIMMRKKAPAVVVPVSAPLSSPPTTNVPPANPPTI